MHKLADPFERRSLIPKPKLARSSSLSPRGSNQSISATARAQLDDLATDVGPSETRATTQDGRPKLPVRAKTFTASTTAQGSKPLSVAQEYTSKEHQENLLRAYRKGLPFRSRVSIDPQSIPELVTPRSDRYAAPSASPILAQGLFSRERHQPAMSASVVVEEESSTETSAQQTYPGMERGYALSPMAELRLEYTEEREFMTSTYSRLQYFVGKRKLDPSFVVDRGISRANPQPRFTMEASLLARVELVASELQGYLRRAAALIPDRRHCFIVDPMNTLIPILKNADDLAELQAAWDTLRTRLELGHKYFDKYDKEYKTSETLLSPSSTATDLYDSLPDLPTAASKLTFLLNKAPHHQEQYSPSIREGSM